MSTFNVAGLVRTVGGSARPRLPAVEVLGRSPGKIHDGEGSLPRMRDNDDLALIAIGNAQACILILSVLDQLRQSVPHALEPRCQLIKRVTFVDWDLG